MAAAGAALPRILGLTGPIGCGKTTVGDLLLEMGALERIDADRVVHTLMTPGTPVTQQIRDAFGPDVLAPDGGVDRPSLARIVFGDPAALRSLEAITHPAVRAVVRDRLEALRGREAIVVLDAVKLLQSALLPMVDAVWVVCCDRAEQARRLREIRGMANNEIQARLSAQPSWEHERVTAVIENSGSRNELRARVFREWRHLLATWGYDAL